MFSDRKAEFEKDVDEKDGGEISALEDEAEIVQAQQPLAEKDLETNARSVNERELPFSKARCIALVVTVTGAAFLNTLGVQSAVIILPTIGRALDIPASRQQWIVSSYNLAFGCFQLLWGRLADVYGKRLIFIWGSVWVTITSIIVPLVPNEIGFDVLRGLQGLGSAAMVPTAIGILGVTFPPGKAKNYAFSSYAAGAPLGAIAGNIFGGVLSQYLSWRWVFWIFGILAALCTVAGYYVIPRPALTAPTPAKKSIDWLGGTIITIGLVVLLFALSEGNVVGWRTPWVPSLLAVSLLLITAFIFWQHHLETRTTTPPLIRISIFANPAFAAANAIMLLFFSSFNNYLINATYWFQSYQGLSVIQTTLRFVPTGVTGILVALATSQLLSRVSGTAILTFGTASLVFASLLFAIPIPDSTSYWAYAFPAMVLAVCGADTLFPTLTLFVAKSLPAADQALGGALVNSVGQVGRAVGLAVAMAVQTAVIAREKGVGVDEVGRGGVEVGVRDGALKKGIRAVAWLDVAFAVAGLVVVGCFFRGAGRVGGRH